tara:strand:+ start:2720 stop:2986 length:267 start_codon:yes stop_codon:yes gene_type:complete
VQSRVYVLQKVTDVSAVGTIVALVKDATLLREEVSSCFPFIGFTIAADWTSTVCNKGLIALYLISVEAIRDNTGILTIDPFTHYMYIH